MEEDETYIKGYLRGKFPAAEMRVVDARYATDPVFAMVVDETRLLMELAELSLRERMRAEAEAAEGRRLAHSRARPRMRMAWAAAAAVLLLVGIGIFWGTRPSLGVEIFKDEFGHLNTNHLTLGAGNEVKAYKFYDAMKYDSALHFLRQIPPESPAGDTAQFYIAFSLIAIDSMNQGIAGMQLYIDRHRAPDPLYYQAHWYLGLGLLREERLEEGKAVLLKLLDMKATVHAEDIVEILERLE